MKETFLSAGEEERLSALYRHQILDTEADPAFDALTRLASQIFRVPYAVVSLVAADRQWFKSKHGLDLCETSRDVAFCAHTIALPEGLIVLDPGTDPRFRDNPLVTGKFGLRFYAGFPIHSADGYPLGAFCILDTERHADFSPRQSAMLKDLAEAASALIRTYDRLQEALSRENAGRRRLSRQLDAVIHASPIAMITEDLDSVVTGWNPAAEKLFGWREAEAMGRPALYLPEHPQDTDPLWEGIYQNQVVTGLECRRRTKSGELVDLSAAAAPLFDEAGKIVGALFLYEDITARLTAQRELRRTASRLDAVLTSTADAVVVADENRSVIAWNKGAEIMFGFDSAEIIGRPFATLIPAHLRAKYDHLLEKLMSAPDLAPSGHLLELSGLRRDGTEFPVELTLNIWLAEDDELTFGTIMRDITERKHLEAEREETMFRLETAKEAAETASNSKSQFLANMSHELRTPLNAVIGFAEMMRDQVLGPLGHPKYRIYADDVAKSGHHLLHIINDVLDLARAESGKLRLNEEYVRLQKLLEDSIRLISPQAEAVGHLLRTDYANAPAGICCDVVRLRQVLVNLLANAVKFTPDGGCITIRATYQEGEAIIIDVEDNGIGIAAEDIPRAFETFSQLEMSHNRRFEGTGLGLPLARHLIELHGGTLTLSSVPGEGTRARITLPPSRAQQDFLAA